MHSARAGQALLLCAALAISPAFASRIHRRPATAGHARTVSVRRGRHHVHAVKMHGQREIDSARATEIQSALIREKYLSGEPSGDWDAETQAAMQKYQADHGWQTKIMPDSRALINLGLGPNHSADTAQNGNSGFGGAPSTTPASAPEPQPNTLASVHSISQ